ncbi:MAG: hypothetical protein ACYDBZ_14390 [Steroidobacteraceae bacterium]
MKLVFLAVALTGALAGAQALAADASTQNTSVVNKRLMLGCMTKRMSASRTVSYNDAKKACIAQLKPQADGAPHPLTAAR